MYMPGLTGLQLLEEVRRLPKFQGSNALFIPPFVLLTSSTDKKLVEQAEKAGFVRVIQKPISLDVLQEVLQAGETGQLVVTHKKPKLLVLDAKSDSRLIVKSALEKSGYDSICVDSAEAAFSAFPMELDWVALICDFTLADFPPAPLIEKLQSIDRYNDEGKIPLPPIIGIQEAASQLSAEVLNELGVRYCLAKPVDPGQLIRSLDELLGNSVDSKKKKILVVDDVKFNLVLAQNLLKKSGYEVICANSGQEALKQIQSDNSIDMVVSDLQMLDLNGLELFKQCQQIRWDSQFGNEGGFPFLLMTGTKNDPRLAEAFQLGVLDVLQKPINGAELVGKVRMALGQTGDVSEPVIN
jgi:CheY-like chemotaxis protein